MTTDSQQPDDDPADWPVGWTEAQFAGLLGGAAPAMRPEFSRKLALRLDAEYAGAAHETSDSIGVSLAVNGSASVNGTSAALGAECGASATLQDRSRVLPIARVKRRRRAAIMLGAAASLLVALAVWSDRPAYGWAAMIEALDRSEWVQTASAGTGGKSSGWLSAVKGVFAVRTEKIAVFTDGRQREASVFLFDKPEVYRAATGSAPAWSWETQLVRMLLAAASKSSAGELLQTSNLRIVVEKQSWQRVVHGDDQLVELKVTLRLRGDDGEPSQLIWLKLLIDPETQLPLECHLLDGEGRVTESFVFSYPGDGPESIFSVGVPNLTPIVNLTAASRLEDLAKIIATAAQHSEERGARSAKVKIAGARGEPSQRVAVRIANATAPPSPAPSPGSVARNGKAPDAPPADVIELTWKPLDAPLAVEELSQQIDRQLAELWDTQQIRPANPASDAEFLRRVYLDLTGRIPSVSEVRRFEEDAGADRRERLVDEILNQRDHATHLAAVWRRILLPDDVDLTRLGGYTKFEEWLAGQFAANTPYDEIVRSLLLAEGRVSESGPLLFYAALKLNPEELAARTSRAFLGMRMECAQCHDHPFDEVSQHDFWSFAAFFARISRPQGKMEITSPVLRVHDSTHGDVMIPESDEVVPPRLPLTGAPVQDAPEGPPRREQLVDWLTARNNGHFARATVNRVWAHLFGRGLVEPVDDMRPDNSAIAPELLELLSRDFAASGFDLRRLLRALVLSDAYQLSSRAAMNDESRTLHFAQMNIKTFTAEQLYDCIAIATQQAASTSGPGAPGSLLRFEDGSRQSFIEQFRAPPGQATDYHAGIPQALTLMHGGLISNVTDLASSGMLRALSAPFFSDEQRLDTLFLATLSRHPTVEERHIMLSELTAATDESQRQQALGDVLWALLNSAEFTFNH